jgi:hypothetical protein|tara:strand:+ start:134 stop:601 length:468 start_codon:yes stop_codon:yes gene_type:complete
MSVLNTIEKKEVKRELTEKQQSFLDHLVETKGDMKEAAKLAGYSSSYHYVVKSLKSEILELTTEILATSAPKAAFKLLEIMESTRPVIQAANKLTAATTVLDRVGVVKIDRVDVNHSVGGGIFLMPDKAPIDLNEEHYDVLGEEDVSSSAYFEEE